MRFAFIHAEKASFPVAALCRLLGVTRQGYYAYAGRPPSPRVADDKALQERLRTLHAESRNTYGSPRLQAALRAEGVHVGKRRVERALLALGLQARPRRRYRITTRANPAHGVAANTLARRFEATRPDERWVTDITYVWTDEGWCYLAVLLDLYSRAVVGWALDAGWAPSVLMPAPVLASELRYGRDCSRHFMRYVFAVNRNAIMRDFIRKLRAFSEAGLGRSAA